MPRPRPSPGRDPGGEPALPAREHHPARGLSKLAPALASSSPPGRRVPLAERLLAWRNRLVASPRFQRWAVAFPPTRPIARHQARSLFDLCAGFVHSQVLLAVVELGLLDALAEGPRSVADLAAELDLPHESCRRLLDAAAGIGLLARRGEERFGLGQLGAALRGQPGVAAMIRHHSMLYADLADPVALLRRGGGDGRLATYWPYAGGPEDALEGEVVAPYSALMAASQPLVAAEILDVYPFARHRALLDIGAGDGAFLSAVARAAPALRLTAFDLPAVADLAEARFAREGLGGRARAVGGDIFREALPAGHDLVSLVRVIHDHDDEPALAILRAAREALAPGGTLLVAEPLADGAGAETYFAFYFLAMGHGRLRSPRELAAMMRSAGFEEVRKIRTRTPLMTGMLIGRASSGKPA